MGHCAQRSVNINVIERSFRGVGIILLTIISDLCWNLNYSDRHSQGDLNAIDFRKSQFL